MQNPSLHHWGCWHSRVNNCHIIRRVIVKLKLNCKLPWERDITNVKVRRRRILIAASVGSYAPASMKPAMMLLMMMGMRMRRRMLLVAAAAVASLWESEADLVVRATTPSSCQASSIDQPYMKAHTDGASPSLIGIHAHQPLYKDHLTSFKDMNGLLRKVIYLSQVNNRGSTVQLNLCYVPPASHNDKLPTFWTAYFQKWNL